MRFSFFKKITKSMPKFTTGFTLVELMVVVAIFGVLTTIVLYKNTDFNNSFLLTDVAYDVALTIRQAQVYGLNVKNSGKGTATQSGFNSGYGVYLDVNTILNNSLLFFADVFPDPSVSVPNPTSGNYSYDGQNELINTFALTKGYKISWFCATTTTGTDYCSNNAVNNLRKLAIVFVRPNPDAIITDNTGSVPPAVSYSSATIRITSPDGLKSKTVKVTTAGQINITD
ncbi:MAG: hypothetical protein RLZZ347_471 [Candidatus Parcubacteria bacterium]|jgi:prepilin-type N-terminal cleavage/methylation domain-containing protein